MYHHASSRCDHIHCNKDRHTTSHSRIYKFSHYAIHICRYHNNFLVWFYPVNSRLNNKFHWHLRTTVHHTVCIQFPCIQDHTHTRIHYFTACTTHDHCNLAFRTYPSSTLLMIIDNLHHTPDIARPSSRVSNDIGMQCPSKCTHRAPHNYRSCHCRCSSVGNTLYCPWRNLHHRADTRFRCNRCCKHIQIWC